MLICPYFEPGRASFGVQLSLIRLAAMLELSSLPHGACDASLLQRRLNEQFVEFFDTDLVAIPKDHPHWL